MAWDDRMKDFHARRAHARGMGGPERLARRRAAGALNARERVERLLDSGSFLEIGTFNTSDVPGMEAETPADSKVGGFGRIDGRDEGGPDATIAGQPDHGQDTLEMAQGAVQ